VRNIDAFKLITRSAYINAQLHANKRAIVAGRNQVNVDTLQTSAKAVDGSDKPLLAIDSSALGGMYAGAIKLIGTEDGVGVELSADMASSSADIVIDANGKLTVTRAAAGRDLTIKAQSIELNDNAYAAGNASVTVTDKTSGQIELAVGKTLGSVPVSNTTATESDFSRSKA